MDAVSGDEAQAGWRRLEDLRPNDLLAALGLEFGPKSVRAFFTPSSSFCFKTLQMVERPVQPPLVVKGHSCSNGSVMAETRDKQLIREGEPSQLTEKELEMPVSGDVGFFDALDKASITLTS